MRRSPERPPDAPVCALAREKEDAAPEHEASRGVARVGIRHEPGRVEFARLRVDVQQRVGPVACQRGVVGVGN